MDKSLDKYKGQFLKGSPPKPKNAKLFEGAVYHQSCQSVYRPGGKIMPKRIAL